MAPDKFEQHIKETLNHRTLQPSPDAWNTLSKRLDSKTIKHKNKPYWWLGIAASFIGVLLVITLVNEKDVVEKSDPVIVNIPKSVEDVKQDDAEETSLKENKELIKKEKVNVPDIFVVNNSNLPTNELKKKTVQPIVLTRKELTFEEQKIQDVAAQIQLLKENHTVVSDSEIDALLLEAQREINLNQLYNNTGVVDATLLLNDVETDLDQSFRGKVFEVLKNSFGTVKSTLANRNN